MESITETLEQAFREVHRTSHRYNLAKAGRPRARPHDPQAARFALECAIKRAHSLIES